MSNTNKLALTQAALKAPTDLKGVFEIEAFRDNFVNNYVKTTGKQDGSIVYEREKILFMKAIQANNKLEKCDRFTIYSSFIELAASGLTLQDDLAYIIPYGDKAQFQPGWKGRLEQISKMPEVQFVNSPILVYESDEFDYEVINGKNVIKKHKPNMKRPEGDEITFVYLSIDTVYGNKIYLMSAADVYSIRDRYSQTYKSYMADITQRNLKPGDSFKKTITPRGGSSFEITVEPPFWVTSPGQAFRKTLVKRVYGELPKTPRMKALDARIASNVDPETGEMHDTQDIDYGIVQDDQPTAELPAKTQTTAATKKVDKAKTASPAPIETPQPEALTESGANPVDDLPELGNLNESF